MASAFCARKISHQASELDIHKAKGDKQRAQLRDRQDHTRENIPQPSLRPA
jgi:hypothetical protein